jgi:hypothetical protein
LEWGTNNQQDLTRGLVVKHIQSFWIPREKL